MLHELRIRAVIDNVLAKHRRGKRGVDFLSIDVLDLSVEDEVVASGVEANCHLAAEKDKRKDIAVLLLVGEEEGIRIHSIGDGAADDGQPVEDDRWLIGVLEQQLLEDIEDNREEDKGGEAGGDDNGRG